MTANNIKVFFIYLILEIFQAMRNSLYRKAEACFRFNSIIPFKLIFQSGNQQNAKNKNYI